MATETLDQQAQMALNSGRTFVWHEVYGPNTEASINFYTKALGFGTTSAEMEGFGTYHMLTKNGQPVAGVIGTAGNPRLSDVPPHWSTYISVDNVDETITKCQQLGATVEVPAMDVPTVGRMALIKDPQGAYVWIFKGEPK